jgi:hypothetical protein
MAKKSRCFSIPSAPTASSAPRPNLAGGGVRQAERVDAEHRGQGRRELEPEREVRRLTAADTFEMSAHEPEHGDPAHGAPHARSSEAPARIGQVVEADAAREHEARRRAEADDRHRDEQRDEGVGPSGADEGERADEAQDREQALRGEQAVGEEADRERGEERCDGPGRVDQADFVRAEPHASLQVM